MENCVHELIECQQCEGEMHCLGWICRGCTYYEIGEYHHRTGCREDFCGDEPVPEETVAPGVGAGSALAA
jgi:hypothetical protein